MSTRRQREHFEKMRRVQAENATLDKLRKAKTADLSEEKEEPKKVSTSKKKAATGKGK